MRLLDTETTKIKTAATSSDDTAAVEPYLRLLRLEKELRNASDLSALELTLVNRIKAMIPCHKAILFRYNHRDALKISAVSDLANPGRDAPVSQATEKLARNIDRQKNTSNIQQFSTDECLELFSDSSLVLPSGHLLWIPVVHPDGKKLGVLWLERRTAFVNHEFILAEHIAHTMAHAWQALMPKSALMEKVKSKPFRWISLMAVTMAMFFPVRLSVLAPAEIIAANPVAFTAPLNGVVREILVDPNQQVVAGNVLAEFEDTELKTRVTVAVDELAVAQAELRKSRQGSFTDVRSAAQVAEQQAKVALKRSELDYARQLLQRSRLIAEQSGIVIFRDKNDWQGKPVQVGEHILYLANPQQVLVKIDLPVRDAITLEQTTEVELYLDTQPLKSLSGKLEYASYEAVPSDDAILSYQLRASLDKEQSTPRIGLKGVAKLYGQDSTLFYYLFRRPLAYLRQWIGF